jgi:Outer membrane receptor proteins, mostly Fe transport
MLQLFKAMMAVVLLALAQQAKAQLPVKGKVIDAFTKEPVQGASLHCSATGCHHGCTTNANGEFEMNCCESSQLVVTSIGYQVQQVSAAGSSCIVHLTPVQSLMKEVVVSANRGEAVKRSEAPVAIASISSKTLQDTKPISADQVLNKISGVNMVSLGNEQHQMSIRQPMTTKSLFLYLEDGIPIRTTGLFNHNALLEMNMTATKSIEVIKGPSSSLYGSEAIGGVVNFISAAPTAVPVMKLSVQGNNIGYKRGDLFSSFSKNKWGVVLSGYYAGKQNSYLEYSDYHKATATARVDYRFSNTTHLTNSITWVDYYSDMSGGIDSIMFAKRVFSNLHTFTYRKVRSLRYRSTLTQQWNDRSKTTASLVYRHNTIAQNPAYRVKNDPNKSLAHGEINESRFNSYAFIAQHKQSLPWKKAVITGGLNFDISPSAYKAGYIRIKKDSASKKYTSYQATDSTLTHYATRLNNYAAFVNAEFNAAKNLRVVASLRYDRFSYHFDNHLRPSAFSGSPDTINHFGRFSPKIGFTWNFGERTGIYANYSEGFVPPQVTELYTGVQVPDLNPSVFYNYEAGGWIEIIRKVLSADISVYRLRGTHEIISVKQPDGSYSNQNAGNTLHTGIEAGVQASPAKGLTIRFSGAYSKHRFVDYTEKGVSYKNNEMNNAPNWMYNAEAWFMPACIKGLRIGLEWQHVGSYYTDPQNTARYDGYDVLHCRAGYRFGAAEVWVNVLNATGAYYSYITTKSAYGYSYQVAEPRTLHAGLMVDVASLFKKK